MGTGVAIIGSALIGAASTAYQSDQQKRLAEEAAEKAERQRALEEAKALQIAQDTRPEGKAVEGIQYGTGDTETGSFSDFLQPKSTKQTSSGLATSGTAGLGFV